MCVVGVCSANTKKNIHVSLVRYVRYVRYVRLVMMGGANKLCVYIVMG